MRNRKFPDRSQHELRCFLENVLCTTDINLDVYSQAFTHKSADGHCNYERLEIMGDSLLSLLLVKMFFEDQPDMTENLITRYKDFLAQNAVLACWSTLWRFERFIQMGHSSTGCDVTIKILADVFEAFLAAMYMNKGMETVYKFVVDTVHLYEQAECSRPYKIFQASLGKPKSKKKRGGRKTSWGFGKVLEIRYGKVKPSATLPADCQREHMAADVLNEPVVIPRKIADPWGDVSHDIPPAQKDGQVIHKATEIFSHPIELIPDSWEEIDIPVKETQLDVKASVKASDPAYKINKESFTHQHYVAANVEKEPKVIEMINEPVSVINSTGTPALEDQQQDECVIIQKSEPASTGETVMEMIKDSASVDAHETLYDVQKDVEMVWESSPCTEMFPETKFTKQANVFFPRLGSVRHVMSQQLLKIKCLIYTQPKCEIYNEIHIRILLY